MEALAGLPFKKPGAYGAHQLRFILERKESVKIIDLLSNFGIYVR